MAAAQTGGIAIGAINERRLRPIYDHLDNGNNKNALHEADKVIKKQRELLAAKVLKCIALHRLNRDEEAFILSQEVATSEPTDENSLQGLSLYYREINRVIGRRDLKTNIKQRNELLEPMGLVDLIPVIYESAVKKVPSNEEYLTHLFMSYVRTERLKDMQRVAMALYKQHPKNPYLFWGIMSMIMQAQHDEKLGKVMFLPLAERMIQKHIENGKIEVETEIRLYLMILDLLEKHDKALEILESSYARFFPSDLDEMKIEIHEKLHLWSKVNSENKIKMKKNPSIWNYVLGYLDSLQNLVTENWKPENSESPGTSSEDPDYSWEQAVVFVKGLKTSERKNCRGTYLAQLELFKRLKKAEDGSIDTSVLENLGDPVEMLMEYIQMFSCKPCCFSDLQGYLKYLDEDQKSKFIDRLKTEESVLIEEGIPDNADESLFRDIEKKVQEQIFFAKIFRFLGANDSLSKEDKISLAREFLRRHRQGLQYSSYRPITDVRVVDDYCLLSVNLMLDVQKEEEGDDVCLLWKCIYILELAKLKSPTNAKIKLLLIRLYCTVGIFMPCAQIYDSLDVKHMQQDTLGYIISNSVSTLGHYQLASQAYEASRAYFMTNDKDSLEFLIACFRNGTFHKVCEFVSFRNRVKNSFHLFSTVTEHVYMDLVTQSDIEIPFTELMESCCLMKSRIDYENLRDNRDFQIAFDWTSKTRESGECEKKISFELEWDWLRFREVQVRSAIALIEHSKKENGTALDNNVDIASLLKELDEITNKIVNEPNLDVKFQIYGPPRPRQNMASKTRYMQIVLRLFRFFEKILCENNSPAAKDDEFEDLQISIVQGIQEILKTCQGGLLLSTTGGDSEQTKKQKNTSCQDCCNHDSACISSVVEGNVESALDLPVPKIYAEIRRNDLERLVLCCELFSLSALLVFNYTSVIFDRKSQSIKQRKRKKGKKELLPLSVTFYNSFCGELKELGSKIKSTLDQLHSKAEVMTLDLDKASIDKETETKLPNGDSNSETQDNSSCTTPPLALSDQILKLSSGSISHSTTQLLQIVQGRLKNLKNIRI